MARPAGIRVREEPEEVSMKRETTFIVLYAVVAIGLAWAPPCQGQGSWTTYSTGNTPAFTENNTFYSAAIDRNGNIWAGNRPTTAGGTGTIYKFDGAAWSKVLDIDGGDKIWTIFVDSGNNIWVGTSGRGVYKYNGSTWAHIRTDVNSTDGVDSLGGDWVKQIAEDQSGNIWFACGPQTSPLADDMTTPGVGGLTKLDTASSRFTKYLSNYNGSNNVGGGNCLLANNWVVAVAVDPSGNVWAGTKGSGVSKFNPTSNTWATYTTANGLGNNTVNPGGLHFAPSTGRIWAGTLAGASWTTDGSSWASISELSAYRVWSIVSDWQGRLWISAPDPASNPQGLFQYDSSGTTQLGRWDNTNGLVDNILRRITIDNKNGKVWCATNSGVTVLSGVVPPNPALAVTGNHLTTEASFRLSQNYPNPFNPETMIAYTLDRPQQVRLTIFNICGEGIRTLVSEARPVGSHVVRWDGRDDRGVRVSSGTYFYQLSNELGRTAVKKALLVQ
jgi:ligand-binding sensor domain-containing protein